MENTHLGNCKQCSIISGKKEGPLLCFASRKNIWPYALIYCYFCSYINITREIIKSGLLNYYTGKVKEGNDNRKWEGGNRDICLRLDREEIKFWFQLRKRIWEQRCSQRIELWKWIEKTWNTEGLCVPESDSEEMSLLEKALLL